MLLLPQERLKVLANGLVILGVVISISRFFDSSPTYIHGLTVAILLILAMFKFVKPLVEQSIQKIRNIIFKG
ncbi:MAG: hypothetical protein VSS52_010395 [Thiotrichaceae bacterium]|nr:hypothetical protein [Thiotrichaceae bacterium]